MGITATQEQIEAGRGYESLFVPALFEPWATHVFDSAGIAENASVLDVACGSGVLARHVHSRLGPGGHVVGLDPAPGMIAAAQEVEPGIEWVLGGAEEMPFDADRFDCVVSQFGMMFFQDRPKALDEMFRVMKPGGTLACAVWNSIEQNPAYGDIVAVLDEHVSTAAGDAVRLPFCLGNPDEVIDLVAKAGFEGVAVETRTEQAKFPSSRTMIEVELRGWLPLFGINLDEGKISEVLTRSDTRLSKYTTPTGEAAFSTSAYIVTAGKP